MPADATPNKDQDSDIAWAFQEPAGETEVPENFDEIVATLDLDEEDVELLGTDKIVALGKKLEAAKPAAESKSETKAEPKSDEKPKPDFKPKPTPAGEFDLGLDPETYTPELVTALGKMTKDFNEKFAAQAKVIEGLTTGARTVNANERVNAAVESSEHLKVQLGGERGAENRQKLIVRIRALEAGYDAIGSDPPAAGDVVAEAARGLFGDTPPTRQTINPPTHASSKSPTAQSKDDATVAAVREFMEERGMRE